MTLGYLEALAGIAVSLSILMAIAWMGQQRTGNSGWVDTIWTFSVGLAGAGSALWPVAGAARWRCALPAHRARLARQFFVAASGLFGYAGGSEWGVSHYRMRAA